MQKQESAMTKERPEALAEFAETARKQQKETGPVRKPLEADEHTVPIPEKNVLKHDAATKVLQEGATGQDKGADEAVQKTQDRIVESRD
jgi:hypothetical protein